MGRIEADKARKLAFATHEVDRLQQVIDDATHKQQAYQAFIATQGSENVHGNQLQN
jgi:hypothetical protein